MSRIHGLDLEVAGFQAGSVDISVSDDKHDFGVIPVPLVTMTRADGPTILLVAGTHGDEYEGQIILRRLIHELPIDEVTGRLIILPALNLPAVQAARRVSPVDSDNLNRSYPGELRGGPTAQIAHTVATELLPKADIVLDLHSGGSQTVYLPSTFVYASTERNAMMAKRRLAELKGLPWAIQVPERFEPRSLSTAADERGIPMISTEMGGGGALDIPTTDVAYSGLQRLLAAEAAISTSEELADPTPVKWLAFEEGSAIRTPAPGLFRPRAALGDAVHPGDVVGHVYFVEDAASPPVPVRSHREGVIAIIRRPPLVEHGAYLFQIGSPMGSDDKRE